MVKENKQTHQIVIILKAEVLSAAIDLKSDKD